MNRSDKRAVVKSEIVLDSVDGSLSRAEWTAYYEQLKAKPVLTIKEMRRLAALMRLPPP